MSKVLEIEEPFPKPGDDRDLNDFTSEEISSDSTPLRSARSTSHKNVPVAKLPSTMQSANGSASMSKASREQTMDFTRAEGVTTKSGEKLALQDRVETEPSPFQESAVNQISKEQEKERKSPSQTQTSFAEKVEQEVKEAATPPRAIVSMKFNEIKNKIIQQDQEVIQEKEDTESVPDFGRNASQDPSKLMQVS